MLYLGIDQHRKQITVNLRNEEGDVILRRQVSTEWRRVKAFLEQLCKDAAPEGGFVAIVEVCGFNDWLLEMLDEYDCQQTVLVQPEKRSKKKTDRRDASALSEVLWVNRLRLLTGRRVQGVRRVQIPSPQDAEDRQLTATRKRLGQVRTRTLNKIQHIVLRHNLHQECPTKGMQTKAARKWLAHLSGPFIAGQSRPTGDEPSSRPMGSVGRTIGRSGGGDQSSTTTKRHSDTHRHSARRQRF